MKKNTNSIIAAMISTAVLGIAVGYGVTFWQNWQASQHALSSLNSPQNSMHSESVERHEIEPAVLDAPRKPLFNEELSIEESAWGQIQSHQNSPIRS